LQAIKRVLTTAKFKEKQMELTVFGNDKPLCLRLVQVGQRVELQAVDDNTGVRIESGTIAIIHSNGTIELKSYVSHKLGLQLDGTGSIRQI